MSAQLTDIERQALQYLAESEGGRNMVSSPELRSALYGVAKFKPWALTEFSELGGSVIAQISEEGRDHLPKVQQP